METRHSGVIGSHLVASLKAIRANPATVNALQKMAQWHVLIRREVLTGPSHKRRRIEQDDDDDDGGDDPMDVSSSSSVKHLTSLPELDEQVFRWLLRHSATSEERYILIRKLLSINKATRELVTTKMSLDDVDEHVPPGAHLETLLIGAAQLNAPDLFIDLASIDEHEEIVFDPADTNAVAAIIQAAAHYKKHGRSNEWIMAYFYRAMNATNTKKKLEKIIAYGIMIGEETSLPFRPDRQLLNTFGRLWRRYEFNPRGPISRYFFSDAAIRLVDRVFAPLLNAPVQPNVFLGNVKIFLADFCEKIEDIAIGRIVADVVRTIAGTFPPNCWIPDDRRRAMTIDDRGDELVFFPQLVPLRVMEAACRQGRIYVNPMDRGEWARSMAFGADCPRYYRLVIDILNAEHMEMIVSDFVFFFDQLNGAPDTEWAWPQMTTQDANSPFYPVTSATHALNALVSWLSDKQPLLDQVGMLYLATLQANRVYRPIVRDAIGGFVKEGTTIRLSRSAMEALLRHHMASLTSPIDTIEVCNSIGLRIVMGGGEDDEISPTFFMWSLMRDDGLGRRNMPHRPHIEPWTYRTTLQEDALLFQDIKASGV